MKYFLILLLPLVDMIQNPVIGQSTNGDFQYVAAKYSYQMDNFGFIIAGLDAPPETSVYNYFIQCGEQKFIHLTYTDDRTLFNPTIRTYFYDKDTFSFTFIIDHVKTYYSASDTLNYSINESRATV